MEITTPTHIGPDADPSLLADKPMSYPPTGNPRVFGPGRARPIDRVTIMVGGGLLVFSLLWLARTYHGYDIWPGFEALTKTDLLLYLFCALLLLVAGIFAAIHPVEKVILRVDDHGLTLRSLRPHDRARTFVPFALLDTVKVSKIPKSTDYTVQIEMRRGAGWRTCAFAARSATGAEGPEIAAEIVRRATASGAAVSEERPSRVMPGRRLWRFEPPTDTQERDA
jgi:hypothetical protein